MAFTFKDLIAAINARIQFAGFTVILVVVFFVVWIFIVSVVSMVACGLVLTDVKLSNLIADSS